MFRRYKFRPLNSKESEAAIKIIGKRPRDTNKELTLAQLFGDSEPVVGRSIGFNLN